MISHCQSKNQSDLSTQLIEKQKHVLSRSYSRLILNQQEDYWLQSRYQSENCKHGETDSEQKQNCRTKTQNMLIMRNDINSIAFFRPVDQLWNGTTRSLMAQWYRRSRFLASFWLGQ